MIILPEKSCTTEQSGYTYDQSKTDTEFFFSQVLIKS